jgi:hypothetical protein
MKRSVAADTPRLRSVMRLYDERYDLTRQPARRDTPRHSALFEKTGTRRQAELVRLATNGA